MPTLKVAAVVLVYGLLLYPFVQLGCLAVLRVRAAGTLPRSGFEQFALHTLPRLGAALLCGCVALFTSASFAG